MIFNRPQDKYKNDFIKKERIIKLQKGSISKRKDGRFMGRFRSVVDNKVICVYAKTKFECAIKLKDAIEQDKKDNILGYKDSGWLVKDWLVYWLEKYEKPKLKETSYNQKLSMFRYVFDSPFAKKRLSTIKDVDAIEFLEPIDRLHTKHLLHSNLITAFDIAMKCGYIKFNPFAIVYKEKYKPERVENNKPLTIEEEKRLLDYLKLTDTKMYYFCKFLLNTGLRRGEALALTWDDIDFYGKKIIVDKAIIANKVTTTKTESGNRIVPMNQVAFDLLQEMRLYKTGNRLFEYSTNYATACFKKVVAHLKMQDQRLHNLRHTYATRLYASGVDLKVIQKVMGHKSHQTTIDIYVDADEDYIFEELKKADTQKALI